MDRGRRKRVPQILSNQCIPERWQRWTATKTSFVVPQPTTARALKSRKRITITTAFHDSEKNVSDYLDCLTNLDYPKECINLLWADNGSIDYTRQLLSDFLKKHEPDYHSVKLIDVPRLSQTEKKDRQIANVMSVLFEHAETNIINIDSDIIFPNDSIHKLLFLNGTYAANICGGITAFIIPEKGRLIPVINAFSFDSISKCLINVGRGFLDEKRILRLPFMKIEVDSCSFALCFIEKRVLRRLKCPVNSHDHNLPLCVDIHFCLDAKSLGFRVMIDTSLYYRHPTLSHKVQIHENNIVIRCT